MQQMRAYETRSPLDPTSHLWITPVVRRAGTPFNKKEKRGLLALGLCARPAALCFIWEKKGPLDIVVCFQCTVYMRSCIINYVYRLVA